MALGLPGDTQQLLTAFPQPLHRVPASLSWKGLRTGVCSVCHGSISRVVSRTLAASSFLKGSGFGESWEVVLLMVRGLPVFPGLLGGS